MLILRLQKKIFVRIKHGRRRAVVTQTTTKSLFAAQQTILLTSLCASSLSGSPRRDFDSIQSARSRTMMTHLVVNDRTIKGADGARGGARRVWLHMFFRTSLNKDFVTGTHLLSYTKSIVVCHTYRIARLTVFFAGLTAFLHDSG